jgi:uncharacterized protein (TIGR00375 family)
MIIRADFHLHGLYSISVSPTMLPSKIAEGATLKGINLVGTADILHHKWQDIVKKELKGTEGLLTDSNGIKFILQTEVEASDRVHNIILFPSFSKVDEVKQRLKCNNFESDGRPRIRMSSAEIFDICKEADCLIGPGHAFTPYTGVFSKYNSLKQAYGRLPDFLELGLSADTNMADRIKELHDITFMSNSDAHSPSPNKLGREFNELEIKEFDYDNVKNAILRKNNCKFVLNAGFNPKEGKYHETRCKYCKRFFSHEESIKFNLRCPDCKKKIKRGVMFRINELATVKEGIHPSHRPPYKYLAPLNELIALTIGVKGATSKRIMKIYDEFVNKQRNEIDVLLNIEIDKLKQINEEVAVMVDNFRNNKIKYIPGGAGFYGELVKP